VKEIAPGISRLTIPLPIAPGHVHCYVIEGDDGRMLVDTGLALPALETLLRSELDGPVERILITHFHPDHVWGGEVARDVTGAHIFQGRLDYEQCERVWGSRDWPERIAAWFRTHGTPTEVADQVLEQARAALPLIRFARDPEPLQDGDVVDGWEVLELPGHADGHLGFFRDGVLAAGDHLLPDITPAVGLYPDSRPDPLGAYLDSLERTIGLEPRLALPSHGEPIEDPIGRAYEILEHHRRRLARTVEALEAEPQTAYRLSFQLFPADLDPPQRRFAVAETLSHVERLVQEGQARHQGSDGSVTYTAA